MSSWWVGISREQWPQALSRHAFKDIKMPVDRLALKVKERSEDFILRRNARLKHLRDLGFRVVSADFDNDVMTSYED